MLLLNMVCLTVALACTPGRVVVAEEASRYSRKARPPRKDR
jgi:hypothetical protein